MTQTPPHAGNVGQQEYPRTRRTSACPECPKNCGRRGKPVATGGQVRQQGWREEPLLLYRLLRWAKVTSILWYSG